MIDSDSPAPVIERHMITDIDGLAQIDPKEVANTEAFQKWAGDNWRDERGVLTDPDGEPVIFYHGGDQGITEFSTENSPNTSQDQVGTYFNSYMPNAKYYASKLQIAQADRGLPLQSSAYAVILKMENPLVIQEGDAFPYWSQDAPLGYDGVFAPQKNDAVAYDPSKIFIVAEAPMPQIPSH